MTWRGSRQTPITSSWWKSDKKIYPQHNLISPLKTFVDTWTYRTQEMCPSTHRPTHPYSVLISQMRFQGLKNVRGTPNRLGYDRQLIGQPESKYVRKIYFACEELRWPERHFSNCILFTLRAYGNALQSTYCCMQHAFNWDVLSWPKLATWTLTFLLINLLRKGLCVRICRTTSWYFWHTAFYF